MKKAVQVGTAPLKSIKPLIVSKGGTPSDPLFNVILLRRWYDESKQYLPKDKPVSFGAFLIFFDFLPELGLLVAGYRLKRSSMYLRTDSSHPDFLMLVRALDVELRSRYGASQDFFDQYNKLDSIRHVILWFEGAQPIGCGAFKQFDSTTVEIKRMFVLKEKRGRGVATGILQSLEEWAFELGYRDFILETGKSQPEALQLYKNAGYLIIPNYGQYQGISESVCMRKQVLHAEP